MSEELTSAQQAARDCIVVALDYDDPAQAYDTARALQGHVGMVKVGLQLFVRGGPTVVETLRGMGHEVFLDLKFYDIPNTVAGAMREAVRLGVRMVNLHALGGPRMMHAARARVRDACDEFQCNAPLMLAVTVLTSYDEQEWRATGMETGIEDAVEFLAWWTKEAGLDGVVASPHEAARLRTKLGPGFVLVTPGVRMPGSGSQDQRRVMTPRDAVENGSDYLVIGRDITGAGDPAENARRVIDHIAGAHAQPAQ